MSVFHLIQDIITISIHAEEKVLSKIKDKNEIDILIFSLNLCFNYSNSLEF
jgi:3-hydroxy-3-methylglutaryl CoA synthase